ncbi:hypothetical protein [Haloarchaeobius sp. HME9146]|uniref:hypothetical protein n=1 Tax=Haloarchaeobius sp. HME9146 TaxID=2978732 RepID=UPI0021BE08E9|nr:hypothetical protein [Haloarchaeobius sp. HME9146]MCT9097928.1 hypothetical protein [Haloarchaeobius sp. HME9146]
MPSFKRRDERTQAAKEECSNCNRMVGHERDLVCEADRTLQIVLCEPCLDSYLEEDWIHQVRE